MWVRPKLTPRDDFRVIGSSPPDQRETAPLPAVTAEDLSSCVATDPAPMAETSSLEPVIPFGDMAANEEREDGFLSPVAQSDPVTSAQKTDVQLLSESEFFDAEWYLTANPDVRSAGLDPVRHYLDFGASEGKKPGPVFDGEEYLASHADVAAAGINPLVHYLRFGRAEGRPLRAAYRDWLAPLRRIVGRRSDCHSFPHRIAAGSTDYFGHRSNLQHRSCRSLCDD